MLPTSERSCPTDHNNQEVSYPELLNEANDSSAFAECARRPVCPADCSSLEWAEAL